MNVVYIHTHDSGKMLSPYGYNVPTPNLMEFTKDALLFRKAFCVGPTCSPSRAGLLTGTYPHQNGMLGLSQRGFALNDYSKHLVNFLKGNNYQTVLCGIQHEAGNYLNHEEGANIIGYDLDITSSNKGLTQEELVKWDVENAKKAKDWLAQYKEDKPFFLSFGMYATHRRYPTELKEGINENYVKPPYPLVDNEIIRKDYARFLTSASWFDDALKIVLDALKENGIYEDTIILFTTDHGIAMPFVKCNLFDTGIGVSLVIRVPESKVNGKVVDQLVSHIDVFPTLCDLLNLEKPNYLEGESFERIFHDTNYKVREEVFSEINFHTSYEPCRSIRTEKYKYIRYYDDYMKINKSNIDDSITKEYYMNNGLQEVEKYKEALYDLTYDVGERNNVVNDNKYKDVLEKLRNRMDEIQEKTKDPILNGNIPVKQGWKVNKVECLHPGSKDPNDYIGNYIGG